MRTIILLAHPGGLPHADKLGVPFWLQWLILALALTIGAWLLIEARAERQARSSGDQPDDTPSGTRLVHASIASPRRVTTPVPTPAPRSLNPLALLVLLAGFVAGWLALDRVRAVDVVTGFIRTDGAAEVARLGFSFAALLWVGAALAPVAPRGAALAFAGAGVIGAFLATASMWERRLEWWGAEAVLQDWPRLPLWAGAAFLLAVFALGAGRYRPRRRTRVFWPGRTKTAPHETGTISTARSSRPPDPTV